MFDTENLFESWHNTFPLDEKTRFVLCVSDANKRLGAIVRRYTAQEARFFLRGDVMNEKDVVSCLAAAEKTALLLGCSVLTTQEKVSPEWFDSVNTFQRQGFKPVNESWVFNGPFTSFSERINRIESILFQKKAVPFDAEITSLNSGQARVRALLNETSMMDDFEFDSRLSSTATAPISVSCSQIAWHKDEVVGVLLVASSPTIGLFDIPIRYILPNYRHTWVNALLIAAGVKHGLRVGAQSIQFEANAKSHRETLFLAKKLGFKRVGIFNRFEKSLKV